MFGIYRLYWGTLVPDDDFGKMTIYKAFIGCTGVSWYLMIILGICHWELGNYRMYLGPLVTDVDFGKITIF